MAQPAMAVDYTWDATPGNGTLEGGAGLWNDVDPNWTINAGVGNVPWGNTATDSAIFGSTGGAVEVDGTLNVQNLTFNSDLYSIVDTNATLGSLNLSAVSALTVTTAAHTATVNTVLAGAGTTLTKSGAGTLVLGGTNTFAGAFVIGAGTVQLTNNSALGTTAGSTSIASGGALDLNGRTIAEGFVATGNGGIIGAGGTNGALYNSDTANLAIISGTINQGAAGSRNFTIGGPGNIRTTVITGGTSTFTLTKIGAGTLTLGNLDTTDNAFLNVDLTAGTILLNKASGSTPKAVSAFTNIAAGTLVRITGTGGNQLAAGITNLNGTFELNGQNETITALSGSGTIRNSHATTASTLTFDSGSAASFNGVMENGGAGTFAFSKAGLGVFTLTNNSTYTGTTTVTNGGLTLDFAAAGGANDNILPSGSALALNNSDGNRTLVFRLTGDTVTNNQTVNGLSFGTANRHQVVLTSGTGGTTNLNLGAISFNNAYVDFVLPTSGSITTTNANGVLSPRITLNNGASFAQVLGGQIVAFSGDLTYATGIEIANLAGYTASSSLRVDGTSTGDVLQGAGTTSLSTIGFYDTAARNVTVGSGNTLQLGTSGTVLRSTTAGSVAIGAPGNAGQLTAGTVATDLILSNANASGTLTVNSAIVNNTGGAVSVRINGSTTGTTVLNGTNTFTGGLLVQNGTLRLGNSSALGGTAGGTTVANTATLELTGGIAVGAEPLALIGDGVGSLGALRNLSGDNTYGGTITFNGAARIGSAAGTLTLDVASGNAIVAGNNSLTFTATGNIVVNDPITQGATNNPTITKSGAGTLFLNAANSLSTGTGGITIDGGTIVVGDIAALSTSRTTSISGTNASGTLRLATNTSVNAYPLGSSSSNPGTLISDRATPGAGITHALGVYGTGNTTTNFSAGPNVTSGTAGISLASVNLSGGSAGTATFNPTDVVVTVTGGVGVNSNAAAKTLNLAGFTAGNAINGVISNGSAGSGSQVAIAKNGPSIWTLAGANTYTGSTTVNSGTLVLNYATQNNSKLADTAALNLGGGILELSGGSHTEVVASTALTSGTSVITRTSGTGKINLNTITVTGGASLNILGNDIATTDNLNVGGILGGWATVTVGGVTSWAVNSTNGPDGSIVAFSGGYTNIPRLGGVIPNTPTADLSIVNETSETGNITLAGSPGSLTEINTLRMDATSGPAVVQFTGATPASDVLKIGGEAGGGIILAAAAQPLTIGTGTGNGVLTTGGTANGGNATLGLNNDSTTNDLTINSVIANNGTTTPDVVGVAKAGAGRVVLTGANTFTGTVAVNAGTLHVGTTTGASTTATLGAGTTVVNDGILVLRRTDEADIDLAGAIGGTGSVSYTGSGVSSQSRYLANNASTYSGGTTISGSRVGASVATAFGTGPVTIEAGGQAYFNPGSAATFANAMTLNGIGWTETAGTLGALRMNANTTLTGAINIASNVRLTADNGATANVNGVISGAGNIEIGVGGSATVGNGNVRFNGANTFTGAVSITGVASGTSTSNPTLIVGNNSALGGTANGTTVNGSILIGSNTAGSRLVLAAGVTVTGETLTLAAASNTRASLVFNSAGTAGWYGNVTLTGTGTNALWNDASNAFLTVGAPGGTDTVTAAGTTLSLRGGSGVGTINSKLSMGTGSLGKTDLGTWVLNNGTSDFTGNTTISAGTLSFGVIANSGQPSAIGAGTTITIGQNNAGAPTGTLQFTGASGGSTNRNISVGNGTLGGTAIIENTVAGQLLTLAGNVTAAAPASPTSLTITGAGNGALNGNINGAPNLALIKAGNGTWTVAGTNTQTGATAVNAGTLVVNGTLSAAAATTTVNAGTIKGIGTIAGPLSVGNAAGTADAVVAPGGSIGTLSVGGLITLGSDSLYDLEINSGNATADLLNGSAGLTIVSGAQLSVTDLGSGLIAEGTALPFITYTGAAPTTALLYGTTPLLDDVTEFAVNGNTFRVDYNYGGNQVALVAVPEPGSVALAALAGIGLLAGRRRRRA